MVLEKTGGAFTFDIDVKSGSEGEWMTKHEAPKRFGNRKGGNRMEVDQVQSAGNQRNRYEALWEEEDINADMPDVFPEEEDRAIGLRGLA